MNQRLTQLGETLLRVFNKFTQNEKKPRHFGVDELLHPSEIHMVMMIGDNEGAHVSELARIAGVTRGAVSQVVAKLEKKGLVKKIEDPHNSLKTVPALTNKGYVAYYAHEQYHEEMDADMYAYVRGLTDDQLRVIEDFLRNIEIMADNRQ